MSAACPVSWCEVDHETHSNPWSDHMARVWHFDTDQLAVSVWAGNAREDGNTSPSIYVQITNTEGAEEVVQNVTLEELDGLVSLLGMASRDISRTLRWAEETRSLNIA